MGCWWGDGGKWGGEKGGDTQLFDADEELLVVALPRRSVAQDGGQAGLDDGLEALEHALGAGVARAEEGVHGGVDPFARLPPFNRCQRNHSCNSRG